MIRILAVAVGFAALTSAVAGPPPTSSDKVLSTRDFGDIRRAVETLRGKKFKREAPVYQISKRELRIISDHDLDKDYPGPKLHRYEELLAWLDMVPPQTDLKAAAANYLVGELAGLYVSEAKEIYIPSFSTGTTNFEKKAPAIDNVVLAHEFTHALEDPYWPMDDPRDDDDTVSTDRGTAHEFMLEGSANREMMEAIPALSARGSPGHYFLLWNLLHSDLGEFVLNVALNHSWKSSNALVEGVPETLARQEAMPYAFGYSFCAEVMRQWGLDGLDYIYDHPPVSSTQVMHPKKCWEWRDLPAQIDLPKTLPGDWTQVSLDTVGEAGAATLFGCQFTNLHHGLQLACGWHGDHVALFEGAGEGRLLLWASSWDSAFAAARFASACVMERQTAHQAVIIANRGSRVEWKSPDGRSGFIQRNGKRVIMVETDRRETLRNAQAWLGEITFTEPPENAARAAANSPFRRFNPLWSWQKDGDYAVTRSLGGLLSRHDRNSVGASDSFLLGMLGETRRTASFHKWELGGGWVARHESEARRGFTKTTLLPWGVLASRCSARLPQSPGQIITRACLLPYGLLFCKTTSAGKSSLSVLGAGVCRQEATNNSGSTVCFRFLGIPIWTTRDTLPKNSRGRDG